MTGVVTGGVSFGTLVLPPLMTNLVARFGWRQSFVMTAVFVIVLGLAGAHFLRSGPGALGLAPYAQSKPGDACVHAKEYSFREAYHTGQFWMVASIYVFWCVCQYTIAVHIVPLRYGNWNFQYQRGSDSVRLQRSQPRQQDNNGQSG
jgi:sugar phosphate permease